MDKSIKLVNDKEKEIFNNYFKEIQKIKSLQVDVKNNADRAMKNRREASILVSKQNEITQALNAPSFISLKNEFQTILKRVKLTITDQDEMEKFSATMTYNFAEGAAIAYIDLKNVLIELDIIKNKAISTS